MTREDEILAGARAEMTLSQIRPYLETMRGAILREWLATAPEDVAGREALWLRYRATTDLELRITRVIQTGNMAEGMTDG